MQLNNKREAISRHSSVTSYRPTSPHQTRQSPIRLLTGLDVGQPYSPHQSSRRASSVSRCSAAAHVDVTRSRDGSRCVVRGPSRHNSMSVVTDDSNMRAQTSVGSASLDEYQHNDLVGCDTDQRHKNNQLHRRHVQLNDNEDVAGDRSAACVTDIVRIKIS